MAAPTSERQEEGDSHPKVSGAPVGRGRDRRASLVIKETAQLLNGLHEDADRSNALMAELEALLASAQHASGPVQDSPGTVEGEIVAAPPLHFAVVQPIQLEDSDGEDEPAARENERKDESAQMEVEPEDEPASPATRTPTPRCGSDKRRSSVVTFDGGSLFGASLPPAGSTAPVLPVTLRSMSFGRSRAATLQTSRSFTEKGNPTLRRNALTDVGGGQVQQQQHYGGGGGAAVTAMAAALAAAGGGGLALSRRASGTEASEFMGYMQGRRSSGMPYTSSNGPALSNGQVFVGTSMRDDLADGGYDGLSLGVGVAQGGGGGGAVAARMGGGGGRFMKLLKGIFQPHAADSATGSHTIPPSGGPPSTASTSTVPTLESALSHGALSSMSPLRGSSRGQVTRGSLSNVPLIVVDPRRAGSVQRHPSSGAPSPLSLGRTTSITAPHGTYALLPTPPSPGACSGGGGPPQQLLRRQASGSGAMLLSGAATPTALLSPTGSVCLGPSSPSATLYGMMGPSSAFDGRLAGGLVSRRSLILRGQLQ